VTLRKPAGDPVTRVDARAKVTGTARYAVDHRADGMAHAVAVRSSRAHAQVVEIDTAAARSQPGVVAVITASDLAGLFPRFGHVIADHPILAIDKVRYAGEPVALVVAETRHAAVDAAAEVAVHYDDLAAAMDASQALDSRAPVLHTETYELGDTTFREANVDGLPGNLAASSSLQWGDADGAFDTADVVVETMAEFPMLYAYAMEPYNALASYTHGHLDVVTTAQHPFQVREDLARIFDLPLSQIRVTVPLIGGGYGSKSYTKVEPLAAVASWRCGRPVRVALDVTESIYTTRANNAFTRVRSGFRHDGTLVAREIDITLDCGAYAENSPLVLAKAVNRCFGPYRIPNLRVTGRAVYTNTAPASSYRGFGAPQGTLAGELNLDQAAERLGIDPAELRRRNLLPCGDTILPGRRPLDADLQADLEMVLDAVGYHGHPRPGRGIGFACSASDAGAFPVSCASVRIQADGSVTVLTGATEMGQGSLTALTQIAATELGVPIEVVSVVHSDTATTPFERTTGASRTTTLTGTAVVRACADARAKLERMAAEVFGVPIEDVKSVDGGVFVAGASTHGFGEVVERWFATRAGEVTGIGTVRPSDEHALVPPFWEIGMVGVEVSVDRDTGVVTVERLATVGDVGFAINPRLVEGQDLGAATQGLGAALFEELVYDGPQLANPNMVDYRVPRTRDVPRSIITMLAERRDGIGPYGAKGAGEGALNPVGPAVAAAVARATGRWPDRLPLTPERVWRLLREEGDSSWPSR
jgi:CO/xanthine dehydrogenase Mo-binding subunit